MKCFSLMLVIMVVAVIALTNIELTFADGQAITTATTGWLPDTSASMVACGTATPVRSNYVNVHVLPNSNAAQTELSIAASPANPDKLLVGANVILNSGATVRQGYYYTSTAGLEWNGDDSLPNQHRGGSDPAVDFDGDGNAYYLTMMSHATPFDLLIYKSTDGGANWSTQIDTVITYSYNADKPHLVIDRSSASHEGNIYAAWTSFSGYPGFTHANIAFRKISKDDWPINTEPVLNLSNGTVGPAGSSTLCQGVNLAVAPDGTVYAVWAVYDGWATGDPSESVFGFNYSLDGGDTWEGARRIVTVDGIRKYPDGDPLPPKEMRANSFPSMAVDTAGGGKGKIYLVWADNRYGDGPGDYQDADILMISSSDGGVTWSDTTNPVRINSDATGNGRDQWFPWVSVDPAGGVNVAFYDCRNDEDNYLTEVWLARSDNGGQSFVNHRLSEVSMEPCLIVSGYEYWGDYVGITSTPDRVYATWWDNRFRPQGFDHGVYQAQLAVVPITAVSGTISQNATWDLTTLISGTVWVDSGVTVTVRPGTKILASDSGTCLRVSGDLVIEGGVRPVFQCETQSAGDWSGIIVCPGGSVDWGDGCVIMDASTAITVQSGAEPMTIEGVRIENCLTTGFELGDSVKLVHDTIVGPLADYGVYVYQCNPVIENCDIRECTYGVYAQGWSGTIRDCNVEGPGSYGVYILTDHEASGTDTTKVISDAIHGVFSGSHLYAGPNAHTRVDSCEFTTSTIDSVQSHFGVKAYDGALVILRHSQIVNCDTAYYSFNSNSNLGVGTGSSAGNNSIYTDTCSGSCAGSRVVHECSIEWLEQYEGGSETDGIGPPDPEPSCELKAEGNWWGLSSPSSSWFTNVDYDPWLSQDPLGKRGYGLAITEESTLPREYLEIGNYPNPFNPATTIEFSLPATERVKVTIFNILGQQVKRLTDRVFAAGVNRVTWDGTDNNGRSVASGIYLYQVTAGSLSSTRKMALVR